MSDLIVDAIWDSTTHGWLHSGAQGETGKSGGLLFSWDSSKIKLLGYEISPNWIWIRCKLINRPHSASNFINVYAPHHHQDKIQLWQDLQKICDTQVNEDLLFSGDFNCVRDARECTNCITGRPNHRNSVTLSCQIIYGIIRWKTTLFHGSDLIKNAVNWIGHCQSKQVIPM